MASVNYRLALEAPWLAQIFDAKAAVRYLRAHARQLKLDTDRLAVAGNSAGIVPAWGGGPGNSMPFPPPGDPPPTAR